MTGGCGCIGREIIRQLNATNRYAVHCLDIFIPPKDRWIDGVVSYIQTDIANFSDISRALQGVDVVFHTAGLLPTNILNTPEAMERVNLTGTRNVVKACIEGGVKRLIYTSSSTVVLSKDPKCRTEHVDEFTPFPEAPLNAYVRTKGKGELEVRRANGVKGLRTCALRLGGVIGGRDNKAMKNLMEEKVVRLGKGNYMVAWTTLKAAAEVHLLAERHLAENSLSCNENVFSVVSTNSKYIDLNSCFSLLNTGKPATEFPLWLLKLMAYINDYTFLLTGCIPFGQDITMSLVEVLIPFSVSTQHTEEKLGWVEKRPMEEIVRECIANH